MNNNFRTSLFAAAIVFMGCMLWFTCAQAQDDILGTLSCPITEYDAEAGDWGYEPEDWDVLVFDAAQGEDSGGNTPGETDPATQIPPEGEPACVEKTESTFLDIVYLGCTTPWQKPGVQKCWKYKDSITYTKPLGRVSPCPEAYSVIRYSCTPACMEPIEPLGFEQAPGPW